MNWQKYEKLKAKGWLTDLEDETHCAGGCGTPIGVDKYQFPPNKYNYCHSFCCVCCPDYHKAICDKEQVESELIAMIKEDS